MVNYQCNLITAEAGIDLPVGHKAGSCVCLDANFYQFHMCLQKTHDTLILQNSDVSADIMISELKDLISRLLWDTILSLMSEKMLLLLTQGIWKPTGWHFRCSSPVYVLLFMCCYCRPAAANICFPVSLMQHVVAPTPWSLPRLRSENFTLRVKGKIAELNHRTSLTVWFIPKCETYTFQWEHVT